MDEQNAAYKIDDCFVCEFKPGTWQTEGPTSTVCMWYRATDVTGNPSALLESGYVHKGDPGRVALKIGDYFSFRGCKPWRFIG